MKVKSSVVLQKAKERLLHGSQSFVCCAIQDVETDLRYEHGKDVSSKALQIFQRYKPAGIADNMKMTQPWWPKGSPDRMVAIDDAIRGAVAAND